jgi:sugar transferase (PEP-CTERM/EpsH1 system associated)
MTEILFLAHRLPYPPNKGDKIRSWHLLDGLARRATVHVATFVDDPADWEHVGAVRAVCGEVCVRPLPRLRARMRGLRGMLSAEALTTAYYRDRELGRWVRDLAARRSLDAVYVFSSSMAQYAEGLPLTGRGARVLDLCDVDSDKWRQYAASHGGPARWIYRREARLLAEYERRAVSGFDATVVVAEAEAKLVRTIAPGFGPRIRVVPNGVDAEYFDPASGGADPYPPGCRVVAFTGAMDYHPNVDAVRWFTNSVFPGVRAAVPDALFAIVGSNPVSEVRALACPGAVIVTGRVADVRPYLAHAAVVSAPLRIARGVQNKVLEAMAMARPVVATHNALQGIPGAGQAGVVLADEAAPMTRCVTQMLLHPRSSEPALRSFVVDGFGWSARIDEVAGLLVAAPQATASSLPGRVAV